MVTVHIVLMALLNAREEFFLVRRKDGNWGLAGGHEEPSDKGRKEASSREVYEEAKLAGIFGQQILFMSHEQKDACVNVYHVLLGYYYGEKPPVPLLQEILEARWFSANEAKNCLSPKSPERLWEL